jgi:glycosyltransferase involved in cell wall biosynthesis
MNKPLVSACLITYNQENFIRECIEGAINQRVDFVYEIIIGDDCSTDNTQQICLEYVSKYPNLIRYNRRDENLGMIGNWKKTINECNGDYIALCEGDDYWTDPLKLQKQVDFMETNPDYSLCFHDALIVYDGVKGKASRFCEYDLPLEISVVDIISNWNIPTASMLIKRESLNNKPFYLSIVYNVDYALHLFLATRGNVRYIPDVMSVYRKQPGGLSYTVRKPGYIRMEIIKLLFYFNMYTDFKYLDLINDRTKKLVEEYDKEIKAPKTIFGKVFSISYISQRLRKSMKRYL